MTTQIEMLKREILDSRKEVQRHTGLSLERQEELFFEAAFAWIELITNNDTQAKEVMPRMREFWGFWKKQWLKIDQAFIETMERTTLSKAKSTDYYKGMHRISFDNQWINNVHAQAQYHIIRKTVKL